MLKDFTIANLLDLNETIAKDLFEGKTYPWEVLPEIGDFILKLGQTLSEEEYDHPSEDVWIAKSAKVAPTACINGPVIIGKEAEVRHCAFIRGKAIIGEGAVVGNSTELKNAVLFNKVQVPHYNYVGDAVLGYKSHMGAGSICSNVKSDKKLVVVKDGDEKIETGLKKFGAMLGDNVEVGCGSCYLFQFRDCELYCTVIIAGSRIYGGKLSQTFVKVDFNSLINSKRAYPSRSVTDDVFYFIKWNHFCLYMKSIFIFSVIYSGCTLC